MVEQVDPPIRHRRLVAFVVVSSLVVGCSHESVGDISRDSTHDRVVTTTTDHAQPEANDDPSSTSEATWPTLPLLPTTTTTTGEPSDPPAPVPDPPGPPGRNSVMVVGDSVLLGTTSAIPEGIPEWLVTYDADGNRRLAQAIDLFEVRRGEIGEAVVIHLGNNYIPGERGDFESQIESVMTRLWFVPRVVWVTVAEVSPSRIEMNESIREAAERWPNMRVADWAPMLSEHPEWTWDGMHLTPDGREAIAQLIAEALGPVDEG